MNTKSISFTGHRILKITAELEHRLEETLKQLIDEGATDFYAGGALGWDTLCEKTVLKLREQHPHIKLHIILPCPMEEQTAKWNSHDKKVYAEIINNADSREVVSPKYTSDCMKRRNARLVNNADCCVCFYNSAKTSSGTAQTIRMAKEAGIRIINLYQP